MKIVFAALIMFILTSVAQAEYKAKLYWTLLPGATSYNVYFATYSLTNKTTTQVSSDFVVGKYTVPGSTNACSVWLESGTTYYLRMSANYLTYESSFTVKFIGNKNQITAWRPMYKWLINYMYKDSTPPTNVTGLTGSQTGIETLIPVDYSSSTYYGRPGYKIFDSTQPCWDFMSGQSTAGVQGMKLYTIYEQTIMDYKNIPADWFDDYME